MCGICGFISTADRVGAPASGPPGGSKSPIPVLRAMGQALAHRGPDDAGQHAERVELGGGRDGVLGLAHRRLSIVDLSPQGRQPMFNEDGTVCLVFNGEIYNYRALRRDLLDAGHVFRTKTDSEVILHGYEQWGRRVFERLVGMFAVGIWDRRRTRLILARDRLGIKPLYYRVDANGVLFASELGAMRAHPDFRPGIDREALALYLDFSYVPAPWTIFRGARKLLPGHTLTWARGAVSHEPYWVPGCGIRPGAGARHGDASGGGPGGMRSGHGVDFDVARGRCRELLLDAVGARLMGDVPLGAFLSGGYDSALVVSLMLAAGASSVDTFSIGFTESTHDESAHARRVAGYLGTHHHERTLTPQQALESLESTAGTHDEPLGDPSSLPTLLVSRFAREAGIVVALSGDGGDELFCGYDRYRTTARLNRIVGLPGPLRDASNALLRRSPWARLRRVAGNSRFDSLADLYHHRMSGWKGGDPFSLVRPDGEQRAAAWRARVLERTSFFRHLSTGSPTDTLATLSAVDISTYLADDILAKVDRASMSVALEVRVPILDHRLVEYAASLPSSIRARNGVGKALLKDIAHEFVPKRLLDRPKSGFGIPVDAWLRGPLRGLLGEKLSPARVEAEGLLDAPAVAGFLSRFDAGETCGGRLLWSLLMFEYWLERSTTGHRTERENRKGVDEEVANAPHPGLHADSQLCSARRRI